MATTDLKLDDPGTLPKPGPIGRIARLSFGVLCGWYVATLVGVTDSLMGGDGHIRREVLNGVVPTVFLISYVVNIGFSRSWKKRPAVVSLIVLAAIAGFGFFLGGGLETELLARAIWIGEVYVFTHLGLSFLVSAVIGTPGCEMRALHDLYSRFSGVPTKEHYCPIGPLHPIDQWESRH